MKILKYLPVVLSCFLIGSGTNAQDKRAIETKVTDLLARLPSDNKTYLNALIEYLDEFSDTTDQAAAKSILMTESGRSEIALLRPVLKDGVFAEKRSVIELMAWSSGNEFFKDVLPYTSSDDETVRKVAYRALADLAEPADISMLIDLLSSTNDKVYIAYVRSALASASGKISDPEKRSDELIKTMNSKVQKEKIIPVLARTGGRKALITVMKEFENGNSETRDTCFRALISWKDNSAVSALYDICASGNKTFEEPAFEGYVNRLKSALMTDEQKLLLLRKIMPYARNKERKNEIIEQTGTLKTYQSLFFVAGYLDDPATSLAAANAAMNIALPSVGLEAGMYGTIVRDILSKATLKLTGPENVYKKEKIDKYLAAMPPDEGFKPMFNGKDLAGWHGLVENPIARSKMSKEELERKQAEADKQVPLNWSVKDGCIFFNGTGDNLCSVTEYGDFEMLVDWKITKNGDSGIYLRGSPQVQIWDTSRTDVGARVGSGGLYNNQIGPSKPLKVADNPVGDWNTFRIMMIGDKVSVWLNGVLVVDKVVMENYWDRKIPIFPKGPIELQAHGTGLEFRDIYVREIFDI